MWYTSISMQNCKALSLFVQDLECFKDLVVNSHYVTVLELREL